MAQKRWVIEGLDIIGGRIVLLKEPVEGVGVILGVLSKAALFEMCVPSLSACAWIPHLSYVDLWIPHLSCVDLWRGRED